MENSFSQEVILQVKKNLKIYKEWLRPDPADALGLSIVKTFFKSLTSLILIAFSPVIFLILLVAFLAAF